MRLSRIPVETRIRLYRKVFYLAITCITFLALIDPRDLIIEDLSDKALHAAAFLALALLMDNSFPKQNFDVRKILFLFLYGVAIELLQHLLPYRQSSALDILANLAGIGMYYFLQSPAREFLQQADEEADNAYP
jgi:VanZ family protein